MANLSFPSSSDFQSLYANPKTTALEAIPGDIQNTLSLQDTIAEQQLKQKQRELLVKQLEEKLSQMEAAKKAGQLAVPTSPSTPVSTQVPQANLGNVANIVPQTGTPVPQEPTPMVPIEQQRQGEFIKEAISAQPKEAINDILKTQLGQSKSITQWKPYGTVDAPNGKTYSLEISPSGEFRQVELPPGSEINTQFYGKVRLKQAISTANKDLADSLSLRHAPQAITRSYNVIGGLVRFKPLEQFARDNGLTNQEIGEIANAVNAITTTSGSTTATITKQLLPKTALQKYSTVEQFLTSKPSQQDYSEFLDRWDKLRKTESPKVEKFIQNYKIQQAASKLQNLDVLGRPDIADNTLRISGVDPKKAREMSKKTQGSFDTSLFGLGDPEDRFNELTAQGLTDSEAQDQVEQEYSQGGQ